MTQVHAYWTFPEDTRVNDMIKQMGIVHTSVGSTNVWQYNNVTIGRPAINFFEEVILKRFNITLIYNKKGLTKSSFVKTEGKHYFIFINNANKIMCTSLEVAMRKAHEALLKHIV